MNHLPSSSQVIASKAFAEPQEPVKQSHSHKACWAQRADTQMSPSRVPGRVHGHTMSSRQASFPVAGDTALCVRKVPRVSTGKHMCAVLQ